MDIFELWVESQKAKGLLSEWPTPPIPSDAPSQGHGACARAWFTEGRVENRGSE